MTRKSTTDLNADQRSYSPGEKQTLVDCCDDDVCVSENEECAEDLDEANFESEQPTKLEDPRDEAEHQLRTEKERAALKAFYNRMNATARKLGLAKTNYAVSHGMHHEHNYSCAMDVAKVSINAMRNHPMFREVVSTKRFSCASRAFPGHTYKWVNTNSMLWDKSKQYFGVKTGITHSAGPSLAVNFVSQCRTFDFLVVILNCKTKEDRFKEIPKLVEWAMQKIQRVKKINYKPSLKQQLLKNLAHF